MKIQEAVTLIRNAGYDSIGPQTWLDLGCGAGTFTYALSELLPEASKIYAVDQYPQKLQQEAGNQVTIEFVLSDFEIDEMDTDEHVTGVMMGNSLHYIKDKKAFLTNLFQRFPSIKQMIFIEYETKVANQWVPYPVTFAQLQDLLKMTKFKEVHKIAERPSVYGQGNMYVAAAR
jgi:ubiquinone/menaquinone biosynthesis C-methylase UbiE